MNWVHCQMFWLVDKVYETGVPLKVEISIWSRTYVFIQLIRRQQLRKRFFFMMSLHFTWASLAWTSSICKIFEYLPSVRHVTSGKSNSVSYCLSDVSYWSFTIPLNWSNGLTIVLAFIVIMSDDVRLWREYKFSILK